jgi:hypothetical protein
MKIHLLGCNAIYSAESQPTIRGTYCLHHHGRRISQGRNQQEEGSKQITRLAACFMLAFLSCPHEQDAAYENINCNFH